MADGLICLLALCWLYLIPCRLCGTVQVHVSQLKEERVEDPATVVSKGESVYVKVRLCAQRCLSPLHGALFLFQELETCV